MINMLCQANDEVSAAPARRLSQVRIDALRTGYQGLLRIGESLNPLLPSSGRPGRTRQSNATNLLARLRTYEDDVLRFTFDPGAPFTNNIAEQAIRMCKARQKVSGCFRTFEARLTFAPSAPISPRCTSKNSTSTIRSFKHYKATCLSLAFAEG